MIKINKNKEKLKENPLEALQRLTQDRVVTEISYEFVNTFWVMEIVLNGSTLTDEYYFELMRVINKLQYSIQFTVTIKYY